MEKLRKGVNAVRSSPQRREIFRNQCEAMKCKFLLPIADIRVRWNSTYDMISRALEIKTGFHATLQVKEELRQYLLSEAEWMSLKYLMEFLKPIKEATTMISKEKTPNVASTTMIYQYLFVRFDEAINNPKGKPEFVNAISKSAKTKLEKYYPDSDGKAYVIGTSTFLFINLTLFKQHIFWSNSYILQPQSH